MMCVIKDLVKRISLFEIDTGWFTFFDMRIFVFLSLILVFLAVPVAAAEFESIFKEEEAPPVFPLTYNTAPAVALKRMPGRVLNVREIDEYKLLIYVVEIEQEDGTIVEVEVDAYNGAIKDIFFERLGRDAQLPKPHFSEDEARRIAQMHLQSLEKRTRRFKVLSSELGIREKRLSYSFKIKERFTIYDVAVEGFTGEVLSAKEEK